MVVDDKKTKLTKQKQELDAACTHSKQIKELQQNLEKGNIKHLNLFDDMYVKTYALKSSL